MFLWNAPSLASRIRAAGCIGMLCLGMTAVVIGVGCSKESRSKAAATKPDQSLKDASQPAVANFRYANMAAQVKYVGNAACVSCHQEQNQSYELTAHRHALAEIDLSQEPSAGSYQHAASGRRYTIEHDAAKRRLIHRESPINSASPELLQEFAVRYVIGSGHHSRSYLIEQDGFLIESPITWYARSAAYSMSPGYDRATHASFERLADFNCLVCHAGEVSQANGNSFKPLIHQQTIGCESCHGPGEPHVQKHQLANDKHANDKLASDPIAKDSSNSGPSTKGQGVEDLSIVHPGRLSREASESICANCHLRGAAAVLMPGKSLVSFRPGMLLQDCRVDYQLSDAEGKMKVVGHVEQMHLSACYTRSDSMTCTTCHDPHSSAPPAARLQTTIQKCLECHSAGCTSPEVSRLAKVPDNNCVTCHMPQTPTDIPHFAFTHHRIGLHDSTQADSRPQVAQDKPASPGSLTPTYASQANPDVQKRNLGLAYFELSENEKSPAAQQEYRGRAESILKVLPKPRGRNGLQDAEVDSVLARLSWEQQDLPNAIELAEVALRDPGIDSRARLNSLFIIGESRFQMQNYTQAKQSLETLVKERRVYSDWILLTLCYTRTGQLDQAIRCLQEAIKINPLRRQAHEMIIEIYKRQNKPELVAQHTALLKEL